MQDKSKLGKRYVCFECELKFYDLNKPDPVCPKCGADQRNDPSPDPRDTVLAKLRGKGGGGKSRENDIAEEEEPEEGADIEDEEVDEEEGETEEVVEEE